MSTNLNLSPEVSTSVFFADTARVNKLFPESEFTPEGVLELANLLGEFRKVRVEQRLLEKGDAYAEVEEKRTRQKQITHLFFEAMQKNHIAQPGLSTEDWIERKVTALRTAGRNSVNRVKHGGLSHQQVIANSAEKSFFAFIRSAWSSYTAEHQLNEVASTAKNSKEKDRPSATVNNGGASKVSVGQAIEIVSLKEQWGRLKDISLGIVCRLEEIVEFNKKVQREELDEADDLVATSMKSLLTALDYLEEQRYLALVNGGIETKEIPARIHSYIKTPAVRELLGLNGSPVTCPLPAAVLAQVPVLKARIAALLPLARTTNEVLNLLNTVKEEMGNVELEGELAVQLNDFLEVFEELESLGDDLSYVFPCEDNSENSLVAMAGQVRNAAAQAYDSDDDSSSEEEALNSPAAAAASAPALTNEELDRLIEEIEEATCDVWDLEPLYGRRTFVTKLGKTVSEETKNTVLDSTHKDPIDNTTPVNGPEYFTRNRDLETVLAIIKRLKDKRSAK